VNSVAEPDPLSGAISAATALPDKYDGLKPELGKGSLIAWDDFPDVTYHKLEMLARVQYKAGVALLRDRDLTYAAEVHVRGLLEFLGHVTYVTGYDSEEAVGSARRRALCVEVGMAKGEFNLLHHRLSERSIPQPDAARAQAKEALEALRELHHDEGCGCRGRDDGSTEPMLKRLAANGGAPFDTLLSLYSSSSLFIHQAFFRRLLEEVAPGVSDYVPATNKHRASLLSWLVMPYELAISEILRTDSAEASDQFHQEALDIFRLPVYQAALRGELD